MQRFVARQNVEHFQLLLEAAPSPEERQRLLVLLEEARRTLCEVEAEAARKPEA